MTQSTKSKKDGREDGFTDVIVAVRAFQSWCAGDFGGGTCL